MYDEKKGGGQPRRGWKIDFAKAQSRDKKWRPQIADFAKAQSRDKKVEAPDHRLR